MTSHSKSEVQYVDVAVAGGGACGLMAGLRAANDRNLTVAIFERSADDRSNTGISSGSLAAGGTRFQRAAGVADSHQQHADEIIAASGDEEWRPIVEAVCAAAPKYVEWLADTGYPIELGVDMPRAGMSVARLHTDIGRLGGGRLIRHLRKLIKRLPNVALVERAPVTDLNVDDNAVTGVVVDQNNMRQIVDASAVVLATDGFAANRELRMRHLGCRNDTVYAGSETSMGDALRWALPIGAQLRNMESALLSGIVVRDYGTRVSPALQFNGAVLLNANGDRFVDEESVGYSALAGILSDQPGGCAVMVFDAAAMAATQESELMRTSISAGAIQDVPSITALANAISASEERARRGLEPLTGRRELTPPYHLAWVTSGVLASQGGLTIDTCGHVLNAEGDPIDGLYAGGGAACGLAGRSPDGYSSGNGLLSALGMGWIIGEHLAGLEKGSG